ncbi:hypothetical protein [Pannonibacter phragmitetus]|uniref:hypothetical protein n=1 Tax=Pannonibacter phragmitetus TaxID=121719 RepID=UPI003D2F1186
MSKFKKLNLIFLSLAWIHTGTPQLFASEAATNDIHLMGLAVYSPSGGVVDSFNASEKGKGYVLPEIKPTCYPKALTFTEDGGPTSGKSVYLSAICDEADKRSIALAKYSLEFDKLADRFLGKGWGAIEFLVPFSLRWYPSDITAIALDKSRRLHVFGEIREKGNKPDPGVFVQRLEETGYVDHTFNVEGLATRTDISQGTIGSLGQDGTAYFLRPSKGDAKGPVLLFSAAPDGTEKTLEIQLGLGEAVPMGTAVGENGQIYVYGHTRPDAERRLFVARINEIGDGLDKTFGKDGVSVFGFGEQSPMSTKLKIKNGKIYILGLLYAQNRSNQGEIFNFPAIAVLNSDGSLDSSFSGDGRRILEFASRPRTALYPYFKDIAISNNGLIYLLGEANDSVAIIAIDPSGEIARGFGAERDSEDGLLLDRSFKMPGSTKLKAVSGVAITLDEAGNLIVLVDVTAYK